MKYLVATLLFLNLSTAMASTTPAGEIVGGPFKGKCQVHQGILAKEELHFDIKPDTKVGARLDDRGHPNAIFVQIINNSFNNKLSIAIVNSQRIILSPPRFCQSRGQYNQCDYIKREAVIPERPRPDEELKMKPLIGTLNFEVNPDYYGHISKVSDAWIETISETNQSFEDRVQLKIDDERTLHCDLKYLNLF